jgi:hypothetical protein
MIKDALSGASRHKVQMSQSTQLPPAQPLYSKAADHGHQRVGFHWIPLDSIGFHGLVHCGTLKPQNPHKYS